MAAPVALHTLAVMAAQLPIQRVEISFVGTPPVAQLERASGVSGVQRVGPIVRCLVAGSFQPFLEALRGHEVLTLHATPAAAASPRFDGDMR